MSGTGVINYGSGNFTSVWNALNYLDLEIHEVDSPEKMEGVDRLILPGVGAFPSAMDRLEHLGMTDAMQNEVIGNRKPLLGICIGMQVLADLGTEFHECRGLGYVAGTVRRFDSDQLGLPVPHMGWNELTILSDCPLFKRMSDSPSFYFVHSYRFEPKDSSSTVATCEYGEDFCACVQNEHIFGVQFHPEKSQHDGLTLLENFCSLS